MSTQIEVHDLHECGRIGRRTGLLCAFLGVVAALLMLQFFGAQWDGLSLWYVPRFLLFLAPLFVAAAFFGTKAGKFLCRQGNRMGLNIAVGVALALGSITVEVQTWTFIYIVTRGSGDVLTGWELVSAWFAPLAIIMMFGGIPAVVLGILYGYWVNKQLQRLEPIIEI